MNIKEAEAFLKYCRKSFSPAIPEDDYYIYFIKNNDRRTVDWVNGYCQKWGIKEIFFYDGK